MRQGFPRQRRPIIEQLQYLVSHNGNTGITHPHEIAPIGRRRDTKGSGDIEFDVLTLVFCHNQPRNHSYVHRQLLDAFSNLIE
ncbi:hypothetical protein AX284_04985 [Pseudomonas sp. HUK17]|uniref:Uncharacterized protein n=1 Tax=Pseudomonas oryzihabitans TaxID=47885 RepID=A0A178LGM8_9PSED|nr:hypothetical protein AX284_04985 [Pseudomonas sp. HUK17]OAN29895.1 hypothetical protein A4V15_02850 [Pseudomonas oryzihabitans]